MNAFGTLLLVIGGNAALLAVLGWLARSLLGQLVAKDLERFKSELASASTSATEKLKHELQLVAQEHQVLVSSLHEKRAQVVAELYGLLVEVQWAAHSFVSPMEWTGEPPKTEKYASAMNTSAEFFRFFDKNRIYLPAGLCSNLEQFIRDMRAKVIGFGVYVRREESYTPEHALEKKHETWMKAWEYFDTEVPKAGAALEAELRAIISASTKSASQPFVQADA